MARKEKEGREIGRRRRGIEGDGERDRGREMEKWWE